MRTFKRKPMSPTARTMSYLLSGLLLALATALIIEGAFGLHIAFAWLIAINIFTLLFYGIDKLNSIWVGADPKRQELKMRIPEAALLLLALFGGSPGAALAIIAFSHKIRKTSFIMAFALILLVQVAFIYLFWDKLSAFIAAITV